MEYSKTLRNAFAFIYVAFAAAISVTWAMDTYLYLTVITCQSLHFVGLLFGLWFFGSLKEVYMPDLAKDWFALVLKASDVVQFFAFVLMLVFKGVLIQIAATAALIGAVLGLSKAYLIMIA